MESLSKRLYELVDVAEREGEESSLVSRIKDDAESLGDGTKKRCPKCGEIRDAEDFWDPKLKSGNGGYGRNCMQCKQPATKATAGRKFRSWRSKHSYRY